MATNSKKLYDHNDVYETDTVIPVDPITGSSTLYNPSYYAGKYYSLYTEMIQKYNTDDCMVWPMYYKSEMFRPKIRNDNGSVSYVQCLILGLNGTDRDMAYRLSSSCGNLWCCNPKHLI